MATDLQTLLDHHDIRAVLMRYIQAADTRNWDLAEQVYAETIVSRVAGVTKTYSRDELLAQHRAGSHSLTERPRRMTKRTADAVGSIPLTVATHFVGNMVIEVDGDAARTETYAIANMFFREGDQDYVLVRGIRYLDCLARLPEGWRITHRCHTLDWTRESTVDYAVDFAARPTLDSVWPR